MNENEKRLFFGYDLKTPWPKDLPEGRILDEENRHMTFAFIGNADLTKVKEMVEGAPKPTFHLAPAGIFNKCLFLPFGKPKGIT